MITAGSKNLAKIADSKSAKVRVGASVDVGKNKQVLRVTGSNYVFNMPKCLPQSIQTGICNDASIGNLISSAQSISNNPKLDPYLQQDGQWMQNMYSQLCETSPVI